MRRHAVYETDIPHPPVESIWGEEGVHADAGQDVENCVGHIPVEVIGTVITCIIIIPTN